MDKLGQVTTATLNLFGFQITYNPTMVIMTWLVMGLLLFFGYLAVRNLKIVPGKSQSLFELIYEFLSEITLSTLGQKDGKRFLPLIITLFTFILFANWIGIIPNLAEILGSIIALIHKIVSPGSVEIIVNGFTNIQVSPNPSSWYSFLFKIPALEEPTKFMGTDLALGILVFIIVHANSLSKKGFLDYFRDYMGDIVPSHGFWILLFPINPFFYLNVIGELSSVVSHAFRLFGNIFGGAMILVIVSTLTKFVFIPVGLNAFFGLFAGIVQAFVFTMLAVTYISQKN